MLSNQPEIETLLAELQKAAEAFDDYLADPSRIGIHAAYGDVKRDITNPAYVEMDEVRKALATSQGWYISQEDLNRYGPDEFIALDGTVIRKTDQGYLNPYGPTGLTGPGILGYSLDGNGKPIPENRAVDIVLQFIDPEDGKLKFIGGFRKDTGQPCFIGGFQEKDALNTAVREFIEEGVSGSINLRQCAPLLYQACMVMQNNECLSPQEKECLASFNIHPEHFSGDIGEATYHFIAKEDPGFVASLTDYFKQKLEIAFQGSSSLDPRTTDQRWIAVTIFTGMIDLHEVNTLLSGQKFSYHLAAGSDLTDLKYHAFDASFVDNAYGSHGSRICRVVAHNLQKLDAIPSTVLDQCRQVIEMIAGKTAPELLESPVRPGASIPNEQKLSNRIANTVKSTLLNLSA